jgi:hypothetical protein
MTMLERSLYFLWPLGLMMSAMTAAEVPNPLMKNGALFQGSGGVFTYENGVRRGIPNMAIFQSHGFDGADVVRVTDAQLQAIPEGAMLPAATPEQVAARAEEFPAFSVPGQDGSLGRLRELFRLHHSSKTEATFETPYLLPSALRPALGPDSSAQKNACLLPRFLAVS